VFVDVHRPWRKVKVTESRTAVDFAACMRDLVNVHFLRLSVFPSSSVISPLTRLAHSIKGIPIGAAAAAPLEPGMPLYPQACQLIEHGGDRNRRTRCPMSRPPASVAQLVTDPALWEQQRNTAGAQIKRMFTTKKARAKMGRAYRLQNTLNPIQRFRRQRKKQPVGNSLPLLSWQSLSSSKMTILDSHSSSLDASE
jgi:hypothetical protein